MAKSPEYMRRYRANKAGASASGENIRAEQQLTADLNDALYGIPVEERKDYYYHIGTNADIAEQLTNEGRYRAAKYDSVTINEDLPKIDGKSEKQVQYAEDIRRKEITSSIAAAINKFNGQVMTQQIKTGKSREQLLDEYFEKTGVSSLSEALNKALREGSRSPFKKYRNMTNARDIIDNR